MNKKTLQRIVTLIFGLAFIGTTGFALLSGLFDQSTTPTATTDSQSSEAQIQAQVRGYEKVLEREPDNLTALTGLAQIYWQTGNTEKAIPIIEKLAELQPERQEYQQLLQALKQQQETPQ